MDEPNAEFIRKCLSKVRLHMSPGHLLPPFGLEKERELVTRFCEQTELKGESHATLLVGPHNSGKSLVLNTALRELEAKTGSSPAAIVLDGYLHCEEAAALAAIAEVLGTHAELVQQQQQLQQRAAEAAVDEAAAEDAAAALASVAELTFHANVVVMLQRWKELHPGKAVFFVLDQLELFAAKSKQNLLYSLLNLMQEKEPPVAIVGMAGVLHIMDMLEKRVKSRFSDRYLLFLPNASVDFALHLLRHVLLLPVDGMGAAHARHVEQWNAHVTGMLADSAFSDFLAKRLEVKSDPRDLFNLIHVAISDLSVARPFLTLADFRSAALHLSPDLKLHALKGAPALEMGLLVAMKLFEEEKIEDYNFEMVYERFQKFAREEFMSVTKPTAFAAFESLLEQELIQKAPRRGAEDRATPKGYRMVRLTPTPAQIEDVLRDKDCLLPQSVITWGTKWVA